MENSTSSALTLINNFAIQAILNFNFNVLFNLFFYSAGATFGVLAAIKILDGLARFMHYKWISKYERRAEDIKELNEKMHDRLVEIGEAMESNKKPDNYSKIKIRLRYNSSRLKKYDKTIYEDINELLDILSSHEKDSEIFISKEVAAQLKILIEQIGEKVDKLWLKKS